jgi:hypothetical protein
MNINDLYSIRVEAFAYALMIIGVIGDHISTGIGLSRDYIKESNPVALNMMNNGTWIRNDIIFIGVSILAVFVFKRAIKNRSSNMILIVPIICGLIRLGVTLWNVSIIFGL